MKNVGIKRAILFLFCIAATGAFARGGSGGGGHSSGGHSYSYGSSGYSSSHGYSGSYNSSGEHYVQGHTRRDGTYVEGHHQTNPNSTQYDNWSTKGNVNPYTGKEGTKEPTR